MAIDVVTNTAFSMHSLNRQYAVATTEVEKSIVLAAGQAIIAVSEGTEGQYTGMPLVWLAGLIFSAVMLGSKDISKTTAWVAVLGLGLLMGKYSIRWVYFLDWKSIREISRKMKHGRALIRKAITHAEPSGYRFSMPRPALVLGLYKKE